MTSQFGIVCGDCREVFPERQKIRPRLIFADPPFNIGHGYRGFNDKMTPDEYATFTEQWIRAMADCLADDGTLCVHGPDHVAELALPVLKACGLTRVEWCIWHYRFGQCGRSSLIDSKCHLLVYARDPKNRVWNPDQILVASDRASKYGDKRTESSSTPGLRVPFDVWGIPSDGPYWGRVQGNNVERREGHPNQLPEVYLERVIKAWSNPGDLVSDPFCGSGTTGTVAVALGRRFFGTDVSLESVTSTLARISEGAKRVGVTQPIKEGAA